MSSGNKKVRVKEPKEEVSDAVTKTVKKTSKASTKTVKATGGSKSGKVSKSAKEKGDKSKERTKSKSADTKREDDKTSKKRYFKLINEKTQKGHGRYTGETPKQAANKSYTKMIQKLRKRGEKIPARSIIYIRESTRGSHKKVYGYEALRQKLSEPLIREIINETTGEKKKIVNKYRNKIKKVAVPVQLTGGKNAKSVKKRSSQRASKEEATATKRASKSKSNSKSKTKKKVASKKANAEAR
jgi:hypothetical protein